MSWWQESHASCQSIFSFIFFTFFYDPSLWSCFLLSCLFVYIHKGLKSQTHEDAARNEAVLSFSLSFPSPFSPHWNPVCLEFPSQGLNWRGWSLESNYAIIAGWSGLARAGEEKMNSMLWGFPNSRSFETTFCRNLTVFTSKDKPSDERLMLKDAL